MKNKRWKRKAKRMIGSSDLLCCDCFFCHLSDFNDYKDNCYSACSGQIRYVEKNVKKENVESQSLYTATKGGDTVERKCPVCGEPLSDKPWCKNCGVYL